MTTVSRIYNKTRMTSANGGTYAGQYPCDGWVDDLEPTPSVEYASWFYHLSTTGRERKRRAMRLWRDLDKIFRRHFLSALPPLRRTKASQNLPIEKDNLSTTGTRDHHAPLIKRHLCVQNRSSFCELSSTISKFWVLFFSRPEIEPFSALQFLVFGCYAKTACNVRENNREHLSQILSERANGVGNCDIFQ